VVTRPADDRFMERALILAERGRGRTSPNPLVGAVIVSADGVVVGQGAHEFAGGPHAEIHALDAAADRARGATLYCTLEPCCHTGRTGPCVVRIVQAGVRRVVAATTDPNPLVAGKGFAFLRSHDVDVCVGVREPAARALNQPFFTLVTEQRPFVIAKAAVSADGMIAARPGAPTELTGTIARRHAQRVRAEIDAIGVGSGTILADDPLLTARGAYRERALTRVIFDRRLRTPPSARVLSTGAAGPVIIVTTAVDARTSDRRAALEARGAEVISAGHDVLPGALRVLGERGIASLLLEGGATLHRAAWDAGLVDFVRLYVTPHTLGATGLPLFGDRAFSALINGTLVDRRVQPLGPDTLIEGYVHGAR
jgi:diaminohydroxyphosphoribosylaminopyrimidine deaminase/5-amino-6-(5-phosphoribosylamino)uracil reductase